MPTVGDVATGVDVAVLGFGFMLMMLWGIYAAWKAKREENRRNNPWGVK